LFPAVKNLTR